MNGRMLTSRRRFVLVGLGLVLAPLVGPIRQAWELAPLESPDSVAGRLGALLERRQSARAIGFEYLRETSEERSIETIVGSLVSSLQNGRQALQTVSDAELRRLVVLGVARDFEQGDTVTLDGWILSRAEARLCALAALT